MTDILPDSNRVLMIALDAAEPRLIERWTADGSLPTLKRLREQGVYGRLDSSADWLGGSPWPTFYSSQTPAEHGFYSYLAWRPQEMASVRPTPDYLPMAPFWYDLSRQGPRVIAVDIPLTYEPKPFNGLQVSNWATHEALVPPATYPADLMDLLRSKFGPPRRSNEEYGLLPYNRLLDIRDDQRILADGVSRLARLLMEKETWDLFLIAFSTTHRCGHKLWDHSGVKGEVPSGSVAEYDDALRQVYISADRAVGELIETAGPDVTTLVFSLHGMGENTSRCELLPDMLQRVLAGGVISDQPAGKRGLLKKVRELIPNRWRNTIKDHMPLALQDWLTSYWRMGRSDWSKTRASCLVADLQGYVRFNVRGREAEGIVEPGLEYQQLVAEITEGLRSFVDEDSGQPVVREVKTSAEVFPAGASRDLLPDLIVQWNLTPVASQRRIVSPRFGAIDLPMPGKNISGRSGNHRPHGFLIGAGPGIQPGTIEGCHIMDLAPTAYELLGRTPPDSMQGQAIPLGAIEAARP
ncbi:MAG: alkaline phosphatase family protein [Gemmatimonadales bacterium]